MNNLIADLTEEKTRISKTEEVNKSHFFKELYKTFGEISKRAESLFENHLKNSNGVIQQLKDLSPETIEERLYEEMQHDIVKIVKKKIKNIANTLYQSFLKSQR